MSLLCMVSAPLTFSGDLASAKVRLVLEKWGCPEGNTLTPLLTLLTLQKATLVLVLSGNHSREGTGEGNNWAGGFLNHLWNVFSHGGLWAPVCRIERKSRRGGGEAMYFPRSLVLHRQKLFGAAEKSFIILIIWCHAVSKSPSKRVSWGFSVLRYLFPGFSNPDTVIYTSSHPCYSVLFNFG